MKRLTIVLALATVLPAASEPLYRSEPVVVTASRTETPLNEVLASVTVIDREKIVDSQANDLLQLLRLESGIDFARTGGPGSQTSLFMRGTNSNHVLVLIDGVRAASPHTGAFAWEGLPLSQVERIEIVRGSRASFYGSDAIGGVIQIFTRRADHTEFRVMVGSHGTRQLEGSGHLSLGGGSLWASIEARDVDGFSSQNSNGFAFDPDDDGFENRSLTLGYQHGVGDTHQLRMLATGGDGEVEFDQGISDTRAFSASVRLSGDLTADWHHEAILGHFDEDRRTEAFFSAFESERTELDWRVDYHALAGHSLSLGIQLSDEEGRQLDTFGNNVVYSASRDDQALYAGWRHAAGRSRFELSTRFDDNSEFGGEWTANGAWGLELGEHWALDLGYGTAFRAPTLSEQFSPGFGGLFAGNPGLQPETSSSAELGVDYHDGGHRLGMSIFQIEIDELISFTGSDFQAINIAQANIQGVEAEYDFRGERWNLAARLTLQDAEDRTAGTPLLRRPDEKLSISLKRNIGDKTLVGAELLFAGKRPDFGASLDDYTLVNLQARYSVDSHWSVEGRLENLLDEDYQLVHGFNTPDRSLYLALRYQP